MIEYFRRRERSTIDTSDYRQVVTCLYDRLFAGVPFALGIFRADGGPPGNWIGQDFSVARSSGAIDQRFCSIEEIEKNWLVRMPLCHGRARFRASLPLQPSSRRRRQLSSLCMPKVSCRSGNLLAPRDECSVASSQAAWRDAGVAEITSEPSQLLAGDGLRAGSSFVLISA